MKKLMIVLVLAAIFAGCSKNNNSDSAKIGDVSSTSSDHFANGDSLFFTLDDGNIVKLVNKPYNGNNDVQASISYKYTGIDPDLNSYKLEYTGYENGYVFINKVSGQISHLSDKILLSPTKKYLCTWREDLRLEQSGNSIEIYEISKKALNPVFSESPEKWGPENAQWLEDGSLIFNRAVEENNDKKIVSVDTLRLYGMNFKLISAQK